MTDVKHPTLEEVEKEKEKVAAAHHEEKLREEAAHASKGKESARVLFKSALPFTKYHFKDGSVAEFVGHKYVTSDPEKMEELRKQFPKAHDAHITEIGAPEKDETKDPEEILRQRFFKEFQEQNCRDSTEHKDMGHYETGNLNMVTTHDIAVAAHQSDAAVCGPKPFAVTPAPASAPASASASAPKK